VNLAERAGLAALHRIDPERAHALSLLALRAGLAAAPGPVTSPRLRVALGGLDLPNPVGLAAGFDKNAVAVAPLTRAGFGFVEVGAATPLPQPGNPRPRLFRLAADQAAINRFGFNNDGAVAIAARLAARIPGPVPVGLNLGANRTSPDRAADFARVLALCGPHADFATVNVSSPNTERLRDLQGPAALAALLAGVMEARAALPRRIPVWLKVSPDLAPDDLAALAETALAAGVDAIVATNTTLARDGLTSAQRNETGGLSGAPLFERSTRVLAQIHRLTGGRIPLVGVGGVRSAEEAWAKITAGAAAVQLYTALAYRGLGLAADIARGLDSLAVRAGFTSVAQATGTARDGWL
jgi:dihydroorotate dehydrogenase